MWTRDASVSVSSHKNDKGQINYVLLTDDIYHNEYELGTFYLNEEPGVKFYRLSKSSNRHSVILIALLLEKANNLLPVYHTSARCVLEKKRYYIPVGQDTTVKGISRRVLASETRPPKPENMQKSRRVLIGYRKHPQPLEVRESFVRERTGDIVL